MSVEQNNICETFMNIMQSAFPDAYINARVHKMFLGADAILITFAGAKTWVNNIIENDVAFMRFLVSIEDNGKVTIEAPAMHSNALRRAGLKFRKITKENEGQAVAHLARWFIKNRDLIKSVAC